MCATRLPPSRCLHDPQRMPHAGTPCKSYRIRKLSESDCYLNVVRFGANNGGLANMEVSQILSTNLPPSDSEGGKWCSIFDNARCSSTRTHLVAPPAPPHPSCVPFGPRGPSTMSVTRRCSSGPTASQGQRYLVTRPCPFRPAPSSFIILKS